MIKIQKAKIDDVKAIQEVFYQTWLATYPNAQAGVTKEDIEERFRNRFSEQEIQKRTDEVLDNSGNRLFLVAKDGEAVIAVCKAVKNREFNQLVAIYVLPNFQRKGIGKMLWEKALDFFDDKKDIIVQLADYNLQAIEFYKKLGFEDTGKRFIDEKLKMPINGVHIPEMEMIIKKNKV